MEYLDTSMLQEQVILEKLSLLQAEQQFVGQAQRIG